MALQCATVFPPVLIALVSNLDNLGVGVAYGIRGTKISEVPNLIIAAITMAGTAGAITFGRGLSTLIAPSTGATVGSLIIIGIGVTTVLTSIVADGARTSSTLPHGDPARGRSGGSDFISYRAAVVLGVALSVNNVGTGIGAGLAGVAPLTTTLLAGAFSLLFIGFGSSAGKALARLLFDKSAQLVSGLALVAIGTAMLSGLL